MVAKKDDNAQPLSIRNNTTKITLSGNTPTQDPKVERPHFENTKIGAKHKTVVTVKCNCGFPNNLYIRGEGIPGLTWSKGVLMKNIKMDEWIWETEFSFTTGLIKILVNDKWYEQGENHKIECGKSVTIVPNF